MMVNWAILGAGKFARETMGPAIHAAKGAKLAGIATATAEKAAPFQAFAPDARVYQTYDEALADPNIDAIYVPLPNHLHVLWMEKALSAGKHVLCEKPIALRAEQIDPLIALRGETGREAAEAFMIAHHPQWHRVRALIWDGAIGSLQHVDGVFTYNNPDASNIRFDPQKGGGSLRDIGVYTIGGTRIATGMNPAELLHVDLEMRAGVDVSARVSARFDGFTAHWMTAMNVHPAQRMVFHGTDGRIEMTAPFNPGKFGEARIEIWQLDGAFRVEHWPAAQQYVAQVEAFGAAISGRAPFAWSLEDARATQSVIDAIYDRGLAG